MCSDNKYKHRTGSNLDVEKRNRKNLVIAGVFSGQGMMFSLALNMTPLPFGSTAQPPPGALPYWYLERGRA